MSNQHKPRLLLIAGPNGSGKTTITEQLLQHTWFAGCTYINPDFIARDRFGDWNSPDAILQAADFAQQQRETCLAQKSDFAFESVFSADDKVDFLHQARAAGFFVRLFFIATTDPQINAARVAQRIGDVEGHSVPIEKIISRYGKSIANCARVAAQIDRLYVYDNSIDGQAPRLIFRASSGKIIKSYTKEMPRWTLPIADSLRASAV